MASVPDTGVGAYCDLRSNRRGCATGTRGEAHEQGHEPEEAGKEEAGQDDEGEEGREEGKEDEQGLRARLTTSAPGRARLAPFLRDSRLSSPAIASPARGRG